MAKSRAKLDKKPALKAAASKNLAFVQEILKGENDNKRPLRTRSDSQATMKKSAEGEETPSTSGITSKGALKEVPRHVKSSVKQKRQASGNAESSSGSSDSDEVIGSGSKKPSVSGSGTQIKAEAKLNPRGSASGSARKKRVDSASSVSSSESSDSKEETDGSGNQTNVKAKASKMNSRRSAHGSAKKKQERKDSESSAASSDSYEKVEIEDSEAARDSGVERQNPGAIDHELINECCKSWKEKYEQLKIDHNKVLGERDEAIRMQNRLTMKMTSTKSEGSVTFTSSDGFPSVERIEQIFRGVPRNKHFTFVRLLMEDIWPDGFENMTRTGSASHNPGGRPKAKKSREGAPIGGQEPLTALDPLKVEFVKEKFYERLVLLGEDIMTATNRMRSECGHLMTRVVSGYKRKQKKMQD